MKRSYNLLGLFIAWLAVFAFFAWRVPASFPTVENAETMLRQSVSVGIAAIGMTYIIVAGMIDLSVGSMVALVTVVIAWCVQRGMNPWLAACVGILAGGLCGLLNGTLTVKLRVTPFIVTLGTLLVFRGLAKGLANEQKIDAPMTALSDIIAKLKPDQKWMLVPPGVWLALVLGVIAALVYRKTVFGRHVVAIGSNESAARYSGVNVARVRVLVFVLGGLMVGLSGLMQFSRLTVGDPTVATGMELDVIAAVVIGGASLSGGEGSIPGALLGAFIMTTIRAGCNQMLLPNWVQEIVTGGIIIAAVALDRWRAANARATSVVQ